MPMKLDNAKPTFERDCGLETCNVALSDLRVPPVLIQWELAPKNKPCAKFAMVLSPPDRRISEIRCGLGNAAGEIGRRSVLFYEAKRARIDGPVPPRPLNL